MQDILNMDKRAEEKITMATEFINKPKMVDRGANI